MLILPHSRVERTQAGHREAIHQDVFQLISDRTRIGPKTTRLICITTAPRISSLKEGTQRAQRDPSPELSPHLPTPWAELVVYYSSGFSLESPWGCFSNILMMSGTPPQANWIWISELGPGHWYFKISWGDFNVKSRLSPAQNIAHFLIDLHFIKYYLLFFQTWKICKNSSKTPLHLYWDFTQMLPFYPLCFMLL